MGWWGGEMEMLELGATPYTGYRNAPTANVERRRTHLPSTKAASSFIHQSTAHLILEEKKRRIKRPMNVAPRACVVRESWRVSSGGRKRRFIGLWIRGLWAKGAGPTYADLHSLTELTTTHIVWSQHTSGNPPPPLQNTHTPAFSHTTPRWSTRHGPTTTAKDRFSYGFSSGSGRA